ncbi:hypothetical protein QAD02_012237 [Eretmocerus hayati]|uniref:Uncharacterized protein n=1 Tax=Eretmocerus hayati TaxID=131215 RepID=A0ACC2NYT8_9HYME|nr:hypothetical protein QAD02_012237 [Eretmocerus hayati]
MRTILPRLLRVLKDPYRVQDQQTKSTKRTRQGKKPPVTKIVQQPKKIKTNDKSNTIPTQEVEEQLMAIKEFISEEEKDYGISYDNFKDFMLGTYHKANIDGIALKFAPDLNLLAGMIKEVRNAAQDRKLYNRLDRLYKKLNKKESDGADSNQGSEIISQERPQGEIE